MMSKKEKSSISFSNKYSKWQKLNWQKINCYVRTLQHKIYEASLQNEQANVYKLQKQLANSIEAKLLATREITQDNVEKRKAGVDGKKGLKPEQRIVFAQSLALNGDSDPVRRTGGAKEKTNNKFVGIPTLKELCKQKLALYCLEPEWEALFEPNSYGFRPGRSPHDAIAALRLGLKNQPKYVYKSDINGCFEEILRTQLIKKLNTYNEMENQIKSWFQSDVIELCRPFQNMIAKKSGSEILSPLLANVALHGLEQALQTLYHKRRHEPGKKTLLHNQGKFTFSRYGVDFVFAHPNFELYGEAVQVVQAFLKNMGINQRQPSFSVTNERINDQKVNVGFDFLGCNFRIYNRKYQATTSNRGKKKDFVLYVTPSKLQRLAHYQRLKKIVWSMKAARQEDLIQNLNPIVRRWCLYYQYYNSSGHFSKLDFKMWFLLLNWATKRHGRKSKTWVISKYFHRYKNQKWRFMTYKNEKPNRLINVHWETHIIQYIKCKANYSPYATTNKELYDFF